MHIAYWMQGRGESAAPQQDTVTELAKFFYEEEGAPEEEKKSWAENFLDMAHQRSGIFVEYDTETYAFSPNIFWSIWLHVP